MSREYIETIEEAVDYVNQVMYEKGFLKTVAGNLAAQYGIGKGKKGSAPVDLNYHAHKSGEEAIAAGVYGRQKKPTPDQELRTKLRHLGKEEQARRDEKRAKVVENRVNQKDGIAGKILPSLEKDRNEKLNNIQKSKEKLEKEQREATARLDKAKKSSDMNKYAGAVKDANDKLSEFNQHASNLKRDANTIMEIKKRRLEQGKDLHTKSTKHQSGYLASGTAPARPTKESVDELRLNVYEAFEEGVITESEKDLFLGVLVFEE